MFGGWLRGRFGSLRQRRETPTFGCRSETFCGNILTVLGASLRFQRMRHWGRMPLSLRNGYATTMIRSMGQRSRPIARGHSGSGISGMRCVVTWRTSSMWAASSWASTGPSDVLRAGQNASSVSRLTSSCRWCHLCRMKDL